jgi:hypothetical protein
LAQRNIKNFKGGDITQYLIFKGFDVVGKTILLVELKIDPLEDPFDGVCMWV